MKIFSSLIVIFVFLASIPPIGAEDRPSLAIMDFKPMADVSPDLAEELAGYFISEIKALASFKLISRSRIDQKFTPRIDGYCDTRAAAVKRGKALQAELVIFAAVRKEGGEYVIESTLVRVPAAKVLNSRSTPVSSTTRGLRAKGAELAAISLVGNFAFIPAGAAPTPMRTRQKPRASYLAASHRDLARPIHTNPIFQRRATRGSLQTIHACRRYGKAPDQRSLLDPIHAPARSKHQIRPASQTADQCRYNHSHHTPYP